MKTPRPMWAFPYDKPALPRTEAELAYWMLVGRWDCAKHFEDCARTLGYVECRIIVVTDLGTWSGQFSTEGTDQSVDALECLTDFWHLTPRVILSTKIEANLQ